EPRLHVPVDGSRIVTGLVRAVLVELEVGAARPHAPRAARGRLGRTGSALEHQPVEDARLLREEHGRPARTKNGVGSHFPARQAYSGRRKMRPAPIFQPRSTADSTSSTSRSAVTPSMSAWKLR